MNETIFTLDYILSHYQQPQYEKSLVERTVLRALVHTLNREELLTLQKTLKRGSSKWSVGKGLYEETIKVLEKLQPHRNESIPALLKAFTDKRNGKVAEARVKLRNRFNTQSFQMQRKILKALLDASSSPSYNKRQRKPTDRDKHHNQATITSPKQNK